MAAVALNDEVLRMPLVDSTERDFEGAVVRFDALSMIWDIHSPLPVV